ncbi:MAG TPA: Wzz/FepE/Etk N-terminal domain-containing protein [Acidimicrobiales bacterium]
MELSFIISAIRRRFWLVILFVILGGVIGMLVSRSQDTNEYEATAAVLVQPPVSSNSPILNPNDPDRYPLSQKRALESLALAEAVAEKIPGETKESVDDATSIKHVSGTDILEIVVRSADAERAALIANTYATTYLEQLRTAPATGQQQGLDQLRQQRDQISQELFELAPDIDAGRRPVGNPPVPGPGDAAAEARRDQLLTDYANLSQQIIALEAANIARVTSSIVENAVVPTETIATSSRLFVLAGLVGGLALGIVAAILAARLSTKVLDRYEAETVLNQPVAGELVQANSLTRSRAAALYELPSALEQVISRICARAQANAVDDRPLVIAVVGTQRHAGTTTLALAMAGRYARTDLNSVIIDFDSHDPELTRLFAAGTGGIPTVLSYLGQPSSNGPVSPSNRSRRIDPTTIYASTPVERVRIIGAGSDHDMLTLRRSEISRILEFAARDVDVVIADAGSLPDAAAAEQLVRLADCVVLAVPLRKLRAATLDTTARLLSGRSELILPVITHPARSRFGARSQAPAAPAGTKPRVDEELEVPARGR